MAFTGANAPPTADSKRATNVSLSESLVEEAKSLDINVSRACDEGLRAKVKQVRREHWKAETKGAAKAWADYIDEHGLPLAKYRMF